MPRPSTPGSLESSTVKENKPMWCSPGRTNSTGLRSGKGRPLRELKPGNRGLSLDGSGRRGDRALIPIVKKAPPPVQRDSPIPVKSNTKLAGAPPCQVPPAVRGQSPVTTCRLMTPKVPVAEQTPPRSRPVKKPISALVTPTNKFRKPVSSNSGTPRGFVTKSKVSTPNGGTSAKPSTPSSSRAREKNQAMEGTPVSKAWERPRAGAAAVGHEIPNSGSRDNNRQGGLSGWAGATAVRGRKASPTHGRPPVKHLFLSPQVSKRTLSKKDLVVRKSVENHGIWVGSVAAQRKQRAPTAVKKGDAVDSEMPPPAQPTNSPEIPKRGSREASGEGIRGYFGAGPMVAPDGVGFVRDRRKCKPRGTLMVGEEGLSIESESSDVIESSVQMPPPSVASVEWMMNNDAKGGVLDDFSSGSLHEPALSTSISDFPPRGHRTSESFEKETKASQEEDGVYDGSLNELRLSSPKDDIYSKFTKRSQAFLRHLDKQTGKSLGKEWTSQEDEVLDGSLEQLRLSSPGDDIYSKFTKRSQAFLQHLETRQSQLTRAVSLSYVRQSLLYNGDDSYRPEEQSGGVADSDMRYDDGDISINWRQGLPSDSMEISADQDSAGKNEEWLRSSLSFTSSWVPPAEGSRRSSGNGNPKTWCTPDSQWYGFSPITPEFHRNSQLPEGGSVAFDALVASSVRRRIMTDQSPSSSSSSPKLDTSCMSLSRSMQVVNPEEFSSGLSAANSSSQETSSSFQFGRSSYASGSANFMELMPLDNFMCQTSSPIERSSFAEEQLCQTASPIDQVYTAGAPIDQVYGGGCSMNSSVGCSLDFSVDCSIDCSVNASDDDDVQYASPITGDYLSPMKPSSPSARSEMMATDLTGLCAEMGAREVRKSSMSRTLEELMRHNFAL